MENPIDGVRNMIPGKVPCWQSRSEKASRFGAATQRILIKPIFLARKRRRIKVELDCYELKGRVFGLLRSVQKTAGAVGLQVIDNTCSAGT